jgi:hypothetical protein
MEYAYMTRYAAILQEKSHLNAYVCAKAPSTTHMTIQENLKSYKN